MMVHEKELVKKVLANAMMMACLWSMGEAKKKAELWADSMAVLRAGSKADMMVHLACCLLAKDARMVFSS